MTKDKYDGAVMKPFAKNDRESVHCPDAPGMIHAYPGNKDNLALLAETLRRFNAYGEMVARVKKDDGLYGNSGNSHSHRVLIADLLALVEPPQPAIKVGSVVEAKDVPIGATVFFGCGVGDHTQRIRQSDEKDDHVSTCFKCCHCGYDSHIVVETKCTILALPK